MSCRRKDIRDLKGCKVGEVAVRGCTRECCPYPDSERSQNIRDHMSESGSAEHSDRTTPHLKGREGLYYDKCQSSYRPKFICAKKDCRRGIKPFFDEGKMEFRIGEWQDWSVRPLIGNCEGLKEAWENKRHIQSHNPGARKIKMKLETLRRRYFAAEEVASVDGEGNVEALTDEDKMWLKKHDPDMWWVEISRMPLNAWMVEYNGKRCPGCAGATTRVGSNFRIPKRKDEKAWRKVEEMIERGEDMNANFSVCATIGKHEDMVDEALRLKGSKDASESWEAEKSRRIEELRSSGKFQVRSTEETTKAR